MKFIGSETKTSYGKCINKSIKMKYVRVRTITYFLFLPIIWRTFKMDLNGEIIKDKICSFISFGDVINQGNVKEK